MAAELRAKNKKEGRDFCSLSPYHGVLAVKHSAARFRGINGASPRTRVPSIYSTVARPNA
jgi:hypothetical protein